MTGAVDIVELDTVGEPSEWNATTISNSSENINGFFIAIYRLTKIKLFSE